MEPPLLPNPPISTTVTTASVAAGTTPQPPPPTSHINYANSVDSSPKSRNTNNSSWDNDHHYQQPPHTAVSGGGKIRLMCSYGGHIIPRPHDKSLCYIGGDTRIFVTDRNTSLSDLSSRLSKTLLSNRPFWLKYQLPNEDLDSLISVTTDEDLENMIEEYDRVTKTSRIRVFLFTSEFDNSVSSIGSLLQSSTKSEDWFVHALNNGGANSISTTNKVFSESSSVNCLLGLDDDVGKLEGSFGGGGAKNVQNNRQDVQSVPDSPMVETTSSFGSTNSTPSLTNLPPIKVHVEENNQRVGIEEQFSQLGVGGGKVEQKLEEGGFMCMTSPPAPAAPVTGTVFSGVPVVVGGDYGSRVFSDDERSDQSVGYRNTAQIQQLQQPQQLQPKPIVPSDLPSPNSVSSESSVTNPLSGQRHFFYQEQGCQIQSGNNRVSPNSVDMKHHSDPNNRVQVQQQQVQDASGYALPVQYDQQHQQMYQQPQQYVHASQYIHHTPSGPVPMTSYYPIYPSQQQQTRPHQHQYPVYFVQSRPSQAYNLPVQQPNYSESAPSNQPQTPPTPSMARNAPASKPEMTAGTYRTADAAAPQLVQIPSGQHQHQQQYVGYSQIHHPSQPIAPTSAATANYAYEQIYYSQAHAPQSAAQYQTMTSHNTSS
ncbi:hypothetical protein K7X08_001202 [Anisodus acutangulus]|uniref:PB1 domain-containing protein n=1 Tax=Anisodus acutangulus TaxID=402998 RepID=A0A9Q1RN60_9SOLA|nr:hypothetical protein K7X08_001202 [Anisodus acutangulus]